MRSRSMVFGMFVLVFGSFQALAGNVTTWRYDTTRAGQITTETQLTPANVNATNFGKLYSYLVDGYVYAQPLYVGGLTVAGAVHNVVYVATEHDSVYAFDADKNQQLWKVTLLDTAHGAAAGATSVPSTDLGTNDIVPEVGITGTPVIDTAASALYVVSKTKENGAYINRLHALDLVTGNEKSGSPVVIQGSVPGNGIGAVNGAVPFTAEWELNRTGLLLFNGQIYVPFAAHGDNGPYHGWIFSYNESLQQTGIYNSSPNGKGNGIWHSGAALAAETVNGVPRLYFAAGNFFQTGTAGPTPTLPYTNTQNYSNSIVRMDLANAKMQVADVWTPYDTVQLSNGDTDQTSGGLILLPDQPGAVVHELIQVGKNGRIEVLNRDDLGGYNSTYNNVAQEIGGQINGLWSTPAYWNGRVYFWGSGDHLKQFSLTNGKLSLTPVVTNTSISSSFPGASPIISSNGTTNGVLWAVRTDAYNAGGAAILYAFDPTNVTTMFYNSTQNAARDTAGKAVKFVLPVVNQGKVYVGTQGEVDVYGLLTAATPTAPTPALAPAPGVYATAQNVSITDSLSGAAIYYTTDGTTPSSTSTRYTAPFAISKTSTVHAIATASGYNASNVVSGVYTIGAAPTLDFSNGFASVAGLTLNGSAVNSDDSRLQLTTGAAYQAGSAFSTQAVNIQSFTTDFTMQLSGTAPLADGVTFAIQANSPTALGPAGGGLGYGPDASGGTGGIPHSVAVKFDVFSNRGEGNDSTGLYLNGASPTLPAVDLTSSKVLLNSGDTISVHLQYDGKTLYLTLKDPVNGAVYTGTFAVDIPTTIGSTTAYVGFTGGTGQFVSSQKILTWTFTPLAQSPLSVQYQSESLPYVSSGPAFRTFAWNGFPDGTGTVLDSIKAGDNVSLKLNFAQAGTYDMHVTSKDFSIRGIWQLSIDGVNVGAPQDEYSLNESLGNLHVGSVVISTAGTHTFKFTVTGKNPAATDYKISFDVLQFDKQ